MKVYFFIFALFSINTLWAEDQSINHDCEKKNFKIFDTKFYEKINQHLNWSAATSDEIMNAGCKIKVVPSMQEMEAFIQTESYNSLDQHSQTTAINGVNFEDESSVLIDAFNNLTSAYDSFGIYPRPENQVDLQAKYTINPECKKSKVCH